MSWNFKNKERALAGVTAYLARSPEPPTFYRFALHHEYFSIDDDDLVFAADKENKIYIIEHHYFPIHETPCGCYVVDKYALSKLKAGIAVRSTEMFSFYAENAKFIGRNWGKKYAYPERRQALNSFYRRSYLRWHYAQREVEKATRGLALLGSSGEANPSWWYPDPQSLQLT